MTRSGYCAFCRRTVFFETSKAGGVCPVCSSTVIEERVAPAARDSIPVPTTVAEGIAGRHDTVLLVDSDDERRHVLRLLFESEDFLVVGEASSQAAAIPLAIRELPAFVVLHYLMPQITGGTTVKVLREIVPDARIVAFSAGLQKAPDWADTFLSQDRIAEIAPLLSLIGPRRHNGALTAFAPGASAVSEGGYESSASNV